MSEGMISDVSIRLFPDLTELKVHAFTWTLFFFFFFFFLFLNPDTISKTERKQQLFQKQKWLSFISLMFSYRNKPKYWDR